MNILGIDPASYSTGIAIISEAKELLLSKTINCSGDNARLRGLMLYDKLIELLNQNNIDKIVIEDVLLNKFSINLNTCRDLCIIHGIILAACHYKGYYPIIYTANNWKSTIGIFNGPEGRSRAAQKERAVKLVKEKYNIDVNDDQADAICIALSYLKNHEKELKS